MKAKQEEETMGDAGEKREGLETKAMEETRGNEEEKWSAGITVKSKSGSGRKQEMNAKEGTRGTKKERRGAQEELRTRMQQLEDGKSTEDKKEGETTNWQ